MKKSVISLILTILVHLFMYVVSFGMEIIEIVFIVPFLGITGGFMMFGRPDLKSIGKGMIYGSFFSVLTIGVLVWLFLSNISGGAFLH